MSDNAIAEIERRLRAAQERRAQATGALAGKHRGGEWEAYAAANAALLEAERELAGARGQPHAIPEDFPIEWDRGAPSPQLIANERRTFLIFYARRTDPAWDGTYARVRRPALDNDEALALVEFKRCVARRFGAPNDEVFHGHPLYGKGLDYYAAQTVANSPWLAELEAINRVHAGYRAEDWRRIKHYVFWFHDSTFECAAEGYEASQFQGGMAGLLAEACARLLE